MLVRCVHHTLRAAARARPRRLATLSSSVRARTWLQHRSARMPAILARFASSSTDAAWTKHTTDDGKAYWHNSVTDESTWEDPFAEAPAPSEATDPDVIEKIYVGAFSDAVKYLKVISLTSCGFTLLAAPLLVVCGDESLSLATRIVVSTGIAGAGIFSTALLNWVTSPYVIDMLLEDGHTVHLRTRTLLGKLIPFQFPVSAIGPKIGSHPFAAFSAEGNNFYVDVKSVTDNALMMKLEQIQEDAKSKSS